MRNKSLNHSTFSFSAKEAFPIYIWTQNLIQTVIGLKEKMEYYNSFKILMTINLLKIKSILKSQICNWKTFQIIIKAKKRFKTILKLQLKCLKICKIKMIIWKQKELSLDKFIKCKYAIKKLSKWTNSKMIKILRKMNWIFQKIHHKRAIFIKFQLSKMISYLKKTTWSKKSKTKK